MDFIDRVFETFAKTDFADISLRGDIPEEEEKSLIPQIGAKKKLTLWDIERILSGVENDNRISGVIVRISDLQIGFARANLIRTRLLDLKVRGKNIIAYLESGGNLEYLIASSANSVYLAPWTMLNLIGLKAEVSFYKEALDKIGVMAHMKGFGEYKSASETFTRNSMSEPYREMINSIIGDLEDQLEKYISEGRGISSGKLKSLIDNGPYMADKAKELSLVDDILYESDLQEEVSKISGTKPHITRASKFLRTLSIKDKLRSFIGKFSSSYPSIAVIADSGMITLGSSRGSGPVKSMGSDSLIKLLDHISKDRKQKALVFRVLSPGGSAIASDLICRKLEEISDTRPVIISMSDVAASGGYLISLGGHKIIADSMTITGSIGIVSGKFDVSGLYDKLGISKEYVLKAKNAMMFSPSKGFSKDEESKLLEIMQYYYHQFVSKVSLARKMDFDQAEKISRGRVWTGRQAKGIGLIDDIGGLDTAINVAKNEAGISENQIPVLKFYSESRGIKLSALLNGSYVIDQFTDIFNSLDSLINENILTILPFNIRIR